MRNGTPQIESLKRTLTILEAVVTDGGQNDLSTLARATGTPVATAHRQVTTLVAEGYLKRISRGRHVAGPRLLGLMHRLDEKQLVANVAAPILDRLAIRTRAIAQLGTLESDMVTYRIKTGHGAAGLFTKVGMQLEAYCSGIGKVLLASLPDAERRGYLANGPFVPLTEHTIVDPELLAGELDRVSAQGFATDDSEIAEGLVCVAVPIREPDGPVLAAISVTQAVDSPGHVERGELLPLLQKAAREIEIAAFC